MFHIVIQSLLASCSLHSVGMATFQWVWDSTTLLMIKSLSVGVFFNFAPLLRHLGHEN